MPRPRRHVLNWDLWLDLDLKLGRTCSFSFFREQKIYIYIYLTTIIFQGIVKKTLFHSHDKRIVTVQGYTVGKNFLTRVRNFCFKAFQPYKKHYFQNVRKCVYLMRQFNEICDLQFFHHSNQFSFFDTKVLITQRNLDKI